MIKYFISLPQEEAHTGHPVGQAGVYAQKLNPYVSQKIVDMVHAGITDTTEIKHSLKYYVNTFLSKEIGRKPLAGDRAFYPLNEDIRNHVSKAKKALDLSKYDQENLRLKLEEWRKCNPQSNFFFRPRRCPEVEKTAETSDQQKEEMLLYIQQEEWQKELLTRYGNTVTLMDATYKTTKYSLPLFFLCVKTNACYTVVAEFILQSETTECLYEALSILKSWNPDWEPQFYLTDYSDTEISAVNKLFPNTQVYLCEFHREQAWERWVKEKKHGLSDIQASSLLNLLRDCANVPPNHNLPDQPFHHFYQNAVNELKESDVWQNNDQVRQWLNAKWLCCPEVSTYFLGVY